MTTKRQIVERQSYEAVVNYWLDTYQQKSVLADVKSELERRAFEKECTAKLIKNGHTSNLRAMELRRAPNTGLRFFDALIA